MGNYLPELTGKQRLVFSVLHGYAVPCRFQRIAWLRRAPGKAMESIFSMGKC